MSSTKKISINPDFFKLNTMTSKKKSKKNAKQKKDNTELIKPDLKKALIEKVNNHRKKIEKEKIKTAEKEKEKEKEKDSNNEIKEIENNIDKSMEYLNTLAKKNNDKKRKKRERKRNRNKTMKNNTPPQESINTTNHSRDPPPYSNLKNSSKMKGRYFAAA